MIVLADDFTGAAEIAAVSLDRGYASAVLREPYAFGASVRHIVLDTDSRLSSAKRAEEAIRVAVPAILDRPDQAIFKKVDSVLRGNVAIELATLATLLGRKRIVLLPANPSADRTIENRRYLIDGVPIDQTEFAKDPTHPASSSDPVQLLGPVPDFQVHYCTHLETLPETGLVLCEASSASDVQAWARKLLPEDLPAGGRDFFESILNLAPSDAVPPENRIAPSITGCLVIQGTVSPTRENFHHQLPADGYRRLRLSPADNKPDSLENASEAIRASMSARRLATLEFERHATVSSSQAATEIERVLKEIFTRLQPAPSPLDSPLHLIVEGGATAALILKTLSLSQLQVVHTWAGGVVSLTSPKYPKLTITTKPGSYPWPEALLHLVQTNNEPPTKTTL